MELINETLRQAYNLYGCDLDTACRRSDEPRSDFDVHERWAFAARFRDVGKPLNLRLSGNPALFYLSCARVLGRLWQCEDKP
jgi:hypothetical protein